ETESFSGDLRFGAQNLLIPALAAWFAPDDVEQYKGRLSYTGRAVIGEEITLTGAAQMKDALLMMLPIQDVRSQLRIQLTRLGRLHEISARSVHGRALGGMLDGEAHLHGDSRYELSSTIQIGSGKIDQLSRALGFEHIVGTGTFDAQAKLQSNDVWKLNALSGPLQIDFQNGDAQSVPILSDLSRIMPVFQLVSTDIRSGRMHAQFGQGQLQIASLALWSDAFSLIGDGSASLISGGLDINALVNTGGGINRQLTQTASQTLLTAALPQLVLLSEFNDLIRNRTIYLHVGGSPSQPTLQPQFAPTLGRALLQNVSRRMLVASPTAVATQKN
ncbi:MAG: AsmA-like C-terminal region-containing protein, partial [Aureliella sp.]